MYRRLCKTIEDNKYQLVDANTNFENIALENPSVDFYTSIYMYSEEQRKLFLQNGTIKGIKDVVTDWLVWDFDSSVFEDAREDTISLWERLIEYSLPEDAIKLYYSGNKGFHVEIRTNNTLSVNQFKAITKQLANDLNTYDRRINDHARAFRIAGSLHPKTGRYKIPLTIEDLKHLSQEEIEHGADDVANVDVEAFKRVTISLPQSILDLGSFQENYKSKVPTQELDDIDWTIRPKHLASCRWALQNGAFGEGDRNNALLCLAATYKNQGDNLDICYRRLKGVCETQAKRNDCERYSDGELYNNIVSYVYNDDFNNGQFTCRKPENWLYDYCQSLGNNKCNHKEEDQLKPKKLEDIHSSFKNYVVNIEKNTIHTGIPSLDEKIFLSTGANVGIIGAPGCHAKDTEILMYDGSIKKVQDVVVGDLLMGPDSTSREVLKLCRGREKMVKITPFRSSSFTVNMSHILHLTPSHLKIKGKLPGNLNIKVSDFLQGVQNSSLLKGYKLIKTGVEYTNFKPLKIDPYILGLWLGDGSSHSTVLTTMDNEIKLAWLEYADKNNLKYKIFTKLDNKASTYSLSGKTPGDNYLRNMLKYYNLFKNKHIPKDYMLSSRSDRLALLAGLIDTDGYCEANKRGWEISSKFSILADNIVHLARSLGFHASINKRKKSCMVNGTKVFGDYYIVYISGQNCKDVPVRLERKKVKEIMNVDPLHQGFKYEILEEDDFFGFTIDKDHLYLTSDFFIHHNSGKSSIALDIVSNTSKMGVHSVLASLDMHYNRMFEKALYRVSGLERDVLYDLFKNNQEQEVMDKLKAEFGNVNFFHKSAPTVSDLREYIIACQEESGEKIKLVLLDYFERVTSDVSDDTAASKRVAGELQDLVNDLDICLITLVQPNKVSLSGGPDTPISSYTSIKGSSYLYQSFRIIVSLWRPFFNPKDFSNDKFMQMAVLKNDLGELAELDFAWDGKRGRITELEDQQYHELQELLKMKEVAKNSKDEGW